MRELIDFARESIREARATGSFFPTSRRASWELTSPLRDRTRPMRVLELGPGTGAVTTAILGALRPGDRLDLCEINERFMELLKRRLAGTPEFEAHRERVGFLCCPAQCLPDGPPYDLIVCSLPFLNFDMPTVAEILSTIRRRSHESTVMTHYSYFFVRTVGGWLGGEAARARMQAVSSYLDEQGRKPMSHVWWNAPPLTVYAMETRPALEAGAPLSGDPLSAAEQAA